MYQQLTKITLGSLLTIAIASPAISSDVTFTEIPGADNGRVLKVSENGAVTFRDDLSFYKWTATNGTIDIGAVAGTSIQTVPNISNDGQTISYNGVNAWGTTAVYKDSNLQEISRHDIIGSSLSADGNFIGGSLYGSGSNGAGGPIAVLNLSDWTVQADYNPDYAGYEVKDFSANGEVQLVATIGTNMFSPSPAYLLNNDETRRQVPVGIQRIVDLSGDGNTVVGQSFYCDNFGYNCTVLWGPSGYQELGMFFANALNYNGSVVVGYVANGDDAGGKIWDQENGIRDISDVLAAKGIDISGWTNVRLYDISDDGSFITGVGKNPQGETIGFLISVLQQCSFGL